MSTSRLNTRMVNFHGISFTNDSTRNKLLSNSLSAMGSRYCPSTVFCLSQRASIPSRASLMPASTNSPTAQGYSLSSTEMMMKGIKMSRSSVS
jgi:hypothetical protein